MHERRESAGQNKKVVCVCVCVQDEVDVCQLEKNIRI